MKTKQKFLMCRPDYFTIAYEINPWMSVKNPADTKMSVRHWEILYNTLCSLGADVSLVEPVEGLPDMVFTANAGLVDGKKVILSHFKYKERQGEERHFERWFHNSGYECHRLPRGIYFEGEGDAVFYKDMVLLGHGFRTDLKSHSYVGEITGREFKSLKLINPHYYHLDTCLLYIKSPDIIIYYPGAFDYEGIEIIEGLPSRTFRIYEDDAGLFVCNSVCVGSNLILDKLTDRLADKLNEFGVKIISVDTSEFMKSGGSVRCMVLGL
ncbi:MAG: amidinotransferase [Nitrospirae bacterium]|nr:amidinotransferase [Nitrospirota bacterium]